MNFANPLAFIAFLTIPAIIIMYLLRQKYKEQIIPSLMLWKQAVAVTQSRSPWQRLKKNLLFFLQLLAATLLVIAFARPYIRGVPVGGDIIIVINNSLSMQATDVPGNRLEAAKAEARKIISAAAPQNTALVISGSQPYIASSFTHDTGLLLNRVNSLTEDFTARNTEYTSELVNNLLDASPSASIIVISDRQEGFDFPGNVQFINVGGNTGNMAVTLLSHTSNGNNVDVLAKVKNYSGGLMSNTLGLYTDGELFNIVDVELGGGEEKEYFFFEVGENVRILQAELIDTDMLAADNVMYDVVYKPSIKKAVLFTQRNIFLETAVSLLPFIELYKGDIEDINDVSGFYIYIYDGVLPENVPEDGHVLIINPPVGNGFVETRDEITIASAANINPAAKLVESGLSFDILKSKELELPKWADTLISGGENNSPLVYAGETSSRKVVVIGFDLHNSDLPLKKEFPIFIYNIFDWFAPVQTAFAQTAGMLVTGGTAYLSLNPGVTGLSVIAPGNSVTGYTPPFEGLMLSNLKTPGIYTLQQKALERYIDEFFAVNIDPYSGESDITGGGISTTADIGEQAGAFLQKDMSSIFLIMLILIIAFEWWVYNRGHVAGGRA